MEITNVPVSFTVLITVAKYLTGSNLREEGSTRAHDFRV